MGIEHSEKRHRARILIVDDHPVVRHGLRQLISAESDLEVCGDAGGEREALERISALRPDLVLVDVSLAQGTGLGLLRSLQASEETVKTLVVSMHDEISLAERCLDAGALGYVNKQEATELLIEAVRRVLLGRIYLSPEMTERLISPKTVGKRGTRAAGIESLSGREIEVFDMVGQALSTREIASRLCLSVKTVETHRENMKRKLKLDSNLALIRCAMSWRLVG